jgi:hypothetical protein
MEKKLSQSPNLEDIFSELKNPVLLIKSKNFRLKIGALEEAGILLSRLERKENVPDFVPPAIRQIFIHFIEVLC